MNDEIKAAIAAATKAAIEEQAKAHKTANDALLAKIAKLEQAAKSQRKKRSQPNGGHSDGTDRIPKKKSKVDSNHNGSNKV